LLSAHVWLQMMKAGAVAPEIHRASTSGTAAYDRASHTRRRRHDRPAGHGQRRERRRDHGRTKSGSNGAKASCTKSRATKATIEASKPYSKRRCSDFDSRLAALRRALVARDESVDRLDELLTSYRLRMCGIRNDHQLHRREHLLLQMSRGREIGVERPDDVQHRDLGRAQRGLRNKETRCAAITGRPSPRNRSSAHIWRCTRPPARRPSRIALFDGLGRQARSYLLGLLLKRPRCSGVSK
jgi:hypothetical protein